MTLTIKERRAEEQGEYLVTDTVFIKNRLIKKEYQEELLRFLLNNDFLYDKFYAYTDYTDILLAFTKYHAMSTVLDIFYQSGLIDESVGKRYKGISHTYCSEGFRGLLKYEIVSSREEKFDKKGDKVKNKSIDRAYMDAFKTQKDIIEHKFPKLLSLFEVIFLHASSIKGIKIENFTLSRVMRFYETGVKSYFGEQLVEFGFPVDAIKKIEDANAGLLSMNAETSKRYVREHLSRIKSVLDEYESKLIEKALKSIF